MVASLLLLLLPLCQALFGTIVRQSRRQGSQVLFVGATNYVVACLLNAALAAAQGPVHVSSVTWRLAVAAGLIYATTFRLIGVSMGRRGLAVPSAIMQLALVIPVGLSVVFWGERPDVVQVVGILLALVALTLLALGRAPEKAATPDPSPARAMGGNSREKQAPASGGDPSPAPPPRCRGVDLCQHGRGVPHTPFSGAGRASPPPSYPPVNGGIRGGWEGLGWGPRSWRARLSCTSRLELPPVPTEAAPLAPVVLLGLFLLQGLAVTAPKAFAEMAPAAEGRIYLALLFGTAALTFLAHWLGPARPRRRDLLWGVALGATNATSNLLTVHVLQRLPGILVYPVSTAGALLVTSAIGLWVWKEPVGKWGRMGMVVALVTVALVSVRQ